MKLKFTKMQGIGNDYVYLDCTREIIPEPSALAKRISDRHFGVGSDGLVLILPGEQGDFRMRMFNADGSEAQMCGNASRCVGKYVYERGLTTKTVLALEAGAGVRELRLNLSEGRVNSVQVDMGAPEFQLERLPVDLNQISEKNLRELVDVHVSICDQVFQMTCVSMGNPHCVIFLPSVEGIPLDAWGRALEYHPLFPERTNVEFVHVLDRTHLRMRVWERGSGETMACGTGACAVLAAAVKNDLAERKAILLLRGGELEIEWEEASGHVMMTGPAEFVFDGEIEI